MRARRGPADRCGRRAAPFASAWSRAEPRRRRLDADRRLRQLRERAGVERVADAHPVVARLELAVRQQVGRRERGRDQPAVLHRALVQLGLGARAEEGDELGEAAREVRRRELAAAELLEPGAPIALGEVGVEAVVLGGEAHQAAEAARAHFAEHERHRHEAVLAARHVRDDDAGQELRRGLVALRAPARDVLAVERGVAGREEQRPHHRGLHRAVEMLAEAGAAALPEREDRVGRGLHGAVMRGLGPAHRDGRAIAVALHVEQPARGGEREVARRAPRVGAPLAEGRDRDVEQRLVLAAQRVVAEAERFERAGRERLDQHVGAADQREEARAVLGALERRAPRSSCRGRRRASRASPPGRPPSPARRAACGATRSRRAARS